jgi:ribosomal protein S18 acetylase RimI-like enzyme
VTAAERVVALRPAREEDWEFFARVYASTRQAELAAVPWSDEERAAFLEQQFAAQSADYRANYPDASFDVVLVAGEPAGRLIVDRRDDEIGIVDIALLPAFRGSGIGTGLLRSLVDESEAAGTPLAIHVERENPARRLYERLGFTPVADLGVYLKLVRPPVRRAVPS